MAVTVFPLRKVCKRMWKVERVINDINNVDVDASDTWKCRWSCSPRTHHLNPPSKFDHTMTFEKKCST